MGFGNLSIINSKYINDCFKLNIVYNSATVNLNVNATIDGHTNFLIFDKPLVETYGDSIVNRDAISIFLRFRPHIQLYCSSRKCGIKYYLSSQVFSNATIVEGEKSTYRLSPIQMYMECLSTSGYWVQNDFINSETNIYSINKPESPPIVSDLLNFKAMGKEKTLNRINTLITFS
jgi:hypothetical protein